MVKLNMGKARQRLAGVSVSLAAALMFLVVFGIRGSAAAQTTYEWHAPDDAKKVTNPEKPTPETLKEAETLFRNNCATCHGIAGQGDGPAAEEMTDPPADLSNAKKMNAQSDGELFWKITTGFSGMPSWSPKFTDTQRWRLVNYLRTLVPEKSKAR